MLLGIQIAVAPAVVSAGEEGAAEQVRTQPARTLKERLGDKASDEQRVDNCKVPPGRRGPKPRPDGCPASASAARTQ